MDYTVQDVIEMLSSAQIAVEQLLDGSLDHADHADLLTFKILIDKTMEDFKGRAALPHDNENASADAQYYNDIYRETGRLRDALEALDGSKLHEQSTLKESCQLAFGAFQESLVTPQQRAAAHAESLEKRNEYGRGVTLIITDEDTPTAHPVLTRSPGLSRGPGLQRSTKGSMLDTSNLNTNNNNSNNNASSSRTPVVAKTGHLNVKWKPQPK